jgi:hypothetical protein
LFVFLFLSFFLSQQRGLADVNGDGSHRRLSQGTREGVMTIMTPSPATASEKWQVDGGLGGQEQ